MDYHAKKRSEDGFALKNIEEKWTIFKDEPRNVIISLETNGFNPFGELHSTYSHCQLSSSK